MKCLASPCNAATRRVVMYYITQYQDQYGPYYDGYVSPLDLVNNNTGLTHLIVGAFYFYDGVVYLNYAPPGHERYDQMWQDLDTMRGRGVKVLATVGGPQKGTYRLLESDFDTYYPLLRDQILHLDGVDLDIEEEMSLTAVERLIDQLRVDFGPGFIITLAPAASDLLGIVGLSGFSTPDLHRECGSCIDWYNTKFYDGWGSLRDKSFFDGIISYGVIPANKIVVGALTNPRNGDSGYVDMATLETTIRSIVSEHPDMGGVFGWEYFMSLPEPEAAAPPWMWTASVSAALARDSSAG